MSAQTTPDGYQLRQISISGLEWGAWRAASESEFHARNGKTGWQARAVFALDTLGADNALTTMIESATWSHPDDAPLTDEIRLVTIGVTMPPAYDFAKRMATGWINRAGYRYPDGHVTGWKPLVAPETLPLHRREVGGNG